ncbi:alpha/beta hydrolase [Desulfobacterota bacterium AH_259_B03_O07]|nr:alpha/beta hydrolase [Desulfobacterota bacterium AH_259_B03_O07]
MRNRNRLYLYESFERSRRSFMTKTIFMIHGMWGNGKSWANYKSFFEEKDYHCITPTLRYHDMDPHEAPDAQLGTTSLLDYAEDLEKEIHQLDVKPVLMGHSMGGLLAQILGSRGLAKALVLLTPASPYGIVVLTPSLIKSFWSILTKWGFWKNPHRQTFDETVYSTLHLLPANQRKEVFDQFVYESGRVVAEIGFWLFDSKKASRVDESKITCPVLVIAGGEDRITPASVVRKVADKYQSVSTYKAFTNHAHWVIGEPGWQEIADYVSNWLAHVLGENT